MPTPSKPLVMTPEQLRDTLVTVIAGVKSEPVAKWRKIVGEVEKLSMASHALSNWSISPKGTAAQKRIVEQCVEIVRAEHPYVAG